MSPAPKRIKVPSVSKARKPITSIDKTGHDKSEVDRANRAPRSTFRCPVTIEGVFSAPKETQVAQFYEARCGWSRPFGRLSHSEKMAWRESLHDNMVLMGFIVYSQLFPSLLRNRIKLNSASHHWNALDGTTDRGRVKLEQRRAAFERLTREGSARSAMKGLPCSVDDTTNILRFLKIEVSDEDLRYRTFIQRDFSAIYGDRGAVGSSSVYSSCACALSLLWFSTVILGRPCCLESIIFPLTTAERRVLEQTFECPGQHFDGPVRGFETDWGVVFSAVDVGHRNMDYVMLERTCQQKYIGGLHVADAFAVFRATVSAEGDTKSVAALVASYKQHSKHGVESGAIVGSLDVLKEKPMEAIGRIDGSVLGAISSTFGQEASLEVQERCLALHDGKSLFDGSVSAKLNEIVTFFDQELWRARKKHKMELTVAANLDGAGLARKIDGGRMLDPTDPTSVEKMHAMLKSLSRQVWSPFKSLIGESLGPSAEYPTEFLRISDEEAGRLYTHASAKGATYKDVANLCTLLMLSFSFQRSQIMREATVDEFELERGEGNYRLIFKGRKFKTASASSSDSMPVSHFKLSPDQSMIIKFVASVGHRFCDVDMKNVSRRLLVNAKGQSWTQKDIATRYKRVGAHWLGIPNFGPHVCRTFWSTYALNTGQVNGSNIADFSSYLQVSSTTLRTSYMGPGANAAAHSLGTEILGGVVNSACTGETSENGASPKGKKLKARRLEFLGDIRASLSEYGGDAKLLFRDLVKKRNASQLVGREKWMRWENTFFGDDGQRFFLRFLEKLGV